MTPTLDTAGLSAQEIADRKAIQAVWVKYWLVINQIVRTPATKRVAILESVAIDPQVTNIVKDAAVFQINGWDNYGIPGHAIYWGPSVNGTSPAIMGDCMDFSNVGRLQTKSGEKLTVGKPAQNFRGVFNLNQHKQWRVSAIEFVKGPSC